MKLPPLVLALAGLLALTALAKPQGQLPAEPRPIYYGVCEGVGSQTTGQPPAFECVNHNCQPGCVQTDVSTPHGPGKICECNYIGPHPFCCSLAFVPGAGGFTTYGSCTSPGCLTAGFCLLIVIPETETTPAVAFVNCDQ